MKASLSPHSLSFGYIVGMTRFELATSGPPDRCATGLRHIPRRQNHLMNQTRVQKYCFFLIPANNSAYILKKPLKNAYTNRNK